MNGKFIENTQINCQRRHNIECSVATVRVLLAPNQSVVGSIDGIDAHVLDFMHAYKKRVYSEKVL